MTLTTTLGRVIQAAEYCDSVPYKERLEELFGADAQKEVSFVDLVNEIGFDDTLLTCRWEQGYVFHWWTFAVQCAKRIEHLLPEELKVTLNRVVENNSRLDEAWDLRNNVLVAYHSIRNEANRFSCYAASVVVDLAETHAYWVTAKEDALDPSCTDSINSRLATEEKVADSVWNVSWFSALAMGEMDSDEFKAEREEQKKLFLDIVG